MVVKNIEIPKDKIEDFCQRWKITEFAFFGSVLRDDFRPDSDVDILVTFALPTLFYRILLLTLNRFEIAGKVHKLLCFCICI